MASIYNKKGMLYISWWDWSQSKTKNRSLKMSNTVKNRKTADEFAKKFQKELDKKKETAQSTGLLQGASISEAFTHFKKNNAHKNIKTIKDYDRFYKKFTERFSEDTPCSSITKLGIEDWINETKNLSLSQNTKHGYYKQLNHFMNFLFEYSYTQMFKINRDVKIRAELKEKIIMTDEHITQIFNGLPEKNDNFKVTIHLLFYTGLRSSDILTIEADKIDLKNRIISYYSPKRKKFREVVFHKDLDVILSDMVKKRKGKRLLDYKNVENLNRAITRYLKILELHSRGYTARSFRKTFITLCRTRYNMDATVVKELVGHEHTNTTDRYYNSVTMDRMKEELEKFKRPVVEVKS